MTAILSWITNDGKPGAASLYLASDSRISTPLENGGYQINDDNCQKVFASKDSPDLFAFCGPISGVNEFIAALINAAPQARLAKHYGEGAESLFAEDLFQHVLGQNEFGLLHGLTVFHGYRFGTRQFGLTSVTFTHNQNFNLKHHSPNADWGLLAIDGYGEKMVVKQQAEYIDTQSESKGYSRWLWMSFYDSLIAPQNPTCGGAPQIAALFGRNGGAELGVFFKDTAYVAGKPKVRDDIEYRDGLFQRVDTQGILLPNAQPQVKMGKPRIFEFAQ